MTVAKVLEKAATKVGQGWTRGASARDVNGAVTNSPSEAVSWCLLGAVDASTSSSRLADLAMSAVEKILGEDPMCWNDSVAKNKRQVASVLRKAAKAAA